VAGELLCVCVCATSMAHLHTHFAPRSWEKVDLYDLSHSLCVTHQSRNPMAHVTLHRRVMHA
jgi:hypothetical protein